MMSRIIKGGLILRDVRWDHETRWGHWDPADLNGEFSWSDERGLNSLQIVSYLATVLAHQPKVGLETQEPYATYLSTLDTLIRRDGYLLNILNQKITSPGEINFSDNDLSFKPYYTLAAACQFGVFGTAKKPFSSLQFQSLCQEIAPFFYESIERAWDVIKAEKQSAFGIIYSVARNGTNGAKEAVQQSLETLREYPLDLVEWPTDNSQRLDLHIDKSMIPLIRRSEDAIPRHQSAALRWCKDPFAFVGGDGMMEEDPTFFLSPFWMAAYHGFKSRNPFEILFTYKEKLPK